MSKYLTLIIGLILAAQAGMAATWYVKTNGNDSAAGTSWDTAKQTIQAGMNVAASNDTVLVANGTYVLTGQITVSNNCPIERPCLRKPKSNFLSLI